MKRYLVGAVIVSIMACVVAVQAQNRGQQPAKKKVVFQGKTFLSGGQFGTGKISKKMFDSLLGYGLVAKDTQNVLRPVISFTFSYAERGVYEDSTGKPGIMTDYYSVESHNGRIPETWLKNLRERSKRGDTATFNEVLASYQDSTRKRFHTEPLKLIITD